MAPISHTIALVYLLNPNTANAAAAKALGGTTDCRDIPEQDIIDANGAPPAPRKLVA